MKTFCSKSCTQSIVLELCSLKHHYFYELIHSCLPIAIISPQFSFVFFEACFILLVPALWVGGTYSNRFFMVVLLWHGNQTT
jgi:hypothetical protein